MKKAATKEVRTYEPSLFDWFSSHVEVGDTSLSRLGLPGKGKPPVSFVVSTPSGPKTFTHQYSVEDDSDVYDSKYVAVYWNGIDPQTVYIHCC